MTQPKNTDGRYYINMFINRELAAELAALGAEKKLSPTRMAQIILHEMFGIEPPHIKPGRSNYKSSTLMNLRGEAKAGEVKPVELSDDDIKQMIKSGQSVAYICGTTKAKWRRVHDIKASL